MKCSLLFVFAASCAFAADLPPASPPANPAVADSLPGAGPFTSRPPYQAKRIADFTKRQQMDQQKLKRINTAVIPATQHGNGYDWMERHNAILQVQAELNPDLVLIGDSITHFFGGKPQTHNDSRKKIGEKVLNSAFAGHRVLNLGFGSDRTQQVLWRLDHGELEGLKPKWVVINIGTNNTSDGNTADEILAGIQAVCARVKKQTPDAKIILMAIFPRDNPATSSRRMLIDEINRLVADYAKKENFTQLDIHAKFLDAEGNIPKSLMPDLCHPVEQGYQIWADALLPLLK